MDGILSVLRTGAPWADLPDRFPSYATCFRRFSTWVKDGTPFVRRYIGLFSHATNLG